MTLGFNPLPQKYGFAKVLRRTCVLSHNGCFHLSGAGARHSKRFGGSKGNIHYPRFFPRSSVIDTHNDAAVVGKITHTNHCSERQGTVSRAEVVFIIPLAVGGFSPVKFVAVIGCNAVEEGFGGFKGRSCICALWR